MPTKEIDQLKSPKDKLIRFFLRSRDKWKEKHHQIKHQCVLLMNQTRAVEKSRAKWKERAIAAEQQARELRQELQQLKNIL